MPTLCVVPKRTSTAENSDLTLLSLPPHLFILNITDPSLEIFHTSWLAKDPSLWGVSDGYH